MKPRSKPEPISAFDGRVLRGERSREAIVAALMELVGSGVLQPTVQQVAERAGVGVRSVFRHFSEMETLYRAMDARLEAEARPLLDGAARTGTLAERVAALTRQRASFFERIAAYKRSGNLVRWRSPFLQDRHLNMQRLLRVDVRRWFPELDDAPAPVLEALDLVTSFEAWERLRFDRQLGAKAAMAVVETAVLALLRELPGKRAGRKPARGA
ncbi:TetR/AcrR family transcriptional regulator [Candidatus Binatia bacterium]|nr:TetR/AcrR family transcriptional regulator [Candidatus Binatia bacterium]